MNIRLNIIWSTVVLLMLSSCYDLDVPIKTMVQEADMYKNDQTVMGIIATIYSGGNKRGGMSPIEGFYPKEGTAELIGRGSGGATMSNADAYWAYQQVRVINGFIETLPKYRANFKEDSYNNFLGEGLFMRAYTYYKMTRKYGGIPIIKKVIDYSSALTEEIQPKRNTEKEVFDFILSDLDESIKFLGTAINEERINRYTAYALKSRIALYAASLGKYQSANEKNYMEGVVGSISQSDAVAYYKLAYEAALEVEKGGYCLFDKYEDKVKNFAQLFLERNNTERIFVRTYLATDKYAGHDFDLLSRPYQLRGNADGATFDPTLELVEEFENTDGSLLKNAWTTANGVPIRYKTPMDAFSKADPRLKASVVLPWDQFQGETVEVQAGIYESYPSGQLHTAVNTTDEFNGRAILGKSGMSTIYNVTGIPSKMTTTGFHIRKYANEALKGTSLIAEASDQAWIDIRYAEMLINRAEIALELIGGGVSSHAGKNLQKDANDCINNIRSRAGTFTYTANVTLTHVRHERLLEFAFENVTEKDYVRWRTAESVFLNKKIHILCPYYVDDAKDFVLIKKELNPNGSMNFSSISYYAPISTTDYQQNPSLVQNPGYTPFK